jgi:hypothetical protein
MEVPIFQQYRIKKKYWNTGLVYVSDKDYRTSYIIFPIFDSFQTKKNVFRTNYIVLQLLDCLCVPCMYSLLASASNNMYFSTTVIFQCSKNKFNKYLAFLLL